MTSIDSALSEVSAALVLSYQEDASREVAYGPARAASHAIIKNLLALFYPGYFDLEIVDVTVRLREVQARLVEHIQAASGGANHAAHALNTTLQFLRQIPALRATLLNDVQAALDGDPAATNRHEIILAYPGLLAVSVHRIAHALWLLKVPLVPRIMNAWAHSRTGADIHPGARLGARFFLDHATGVVIGETASIGDGVKLYQGVTLGAASFPKDAHGNLVRGSKRHPTVEDGVTIYANATILGGQTVIGARSIIGASVFVTKSVPPGSRVLVREGHIAQMKVRSDGEPLDDPFVDFQI